MAVGSSTGKENKNILWCGILRIAWSGLCVAALAACWILPVRAVPAVLSSPSAVIYEQSSEESAPVGNLVQGGSFEYLGDVTAEDGSVWHAVATSTGVAGYIRGELAVEEREQEEPGETEQNVPEEVTGQEPGEAQPGNAAAGLEAPDREENQTGIQGEESGMGEIPQEENPEDGEESLEVQYIQNNRAKTYASEALGGKIKESENASAERPGIGIENKDENRKAQKTDSMLVFCIIMMIFFAVIAGIFWKKLKQAGWKWEYTGNRNDWKENDGFPEHFRAKGYKKMERRKQKNRRKRNRKKKQKMKKEAMKIQKATK